MRIQKEKADRTRIIRTDPGGDSRAWKWRLSAVRTGAALAAAGLLTAAAFLFPGRAQAASYGSFAEAAAASSTNSPDGTSFSPTIRQTSSGIRSLRSAALGSGSRYRFLQGSCTTGKYGYFLLGDKEYRPYCALVKVRLSDWKIMKVRRHLKLYHGNDMTYDTKRKKLVVVHGSGDAKGLSLIDTKTLKIEQTVHIDTGIHGVAYSASYDRYVTASGDSIQIRDSNWNRESSFATARLAGYTRQGIDCEDSCIYVLQSNLTKKRTRILIYGWDGAWIHTSYLKGALEGESLFHVGHRFVLSYNTGSYLGGRIYETALRRYYIVRYSPGSGRGKQVVRAASTDSRLYVKRCGYKKTGYQFNGWTITRRSTGKTLCRNRRTKAWQWVKLSLQNSDSDWQPYRIRGGRKIRALTPDCGECVVLTAQWKKKT